MIQRLNHPASKGTYPLEKAYPPNNALRILYWNIWYKSSAAEILAAIKLIDCDALFLFELNRRSGLLPMIHEAGYGGRFVETNSFGFLNKVDAGIAFFSRLRCGYIKNVVLSQGRRGLWRGGKDSRRCYLEAKLCIPGQVAIVVGGTHTSYKIPFIGSNSYYRETSTLIREASKHKLRYIFGGDLNAEQHSPLLGALSNNFAYLDTGNRYSWAVRRWAKILPGRLLDHAFATDDLEGTKAEFLENYSSDHLPLVVTVPLNR